MKKNLALLFLASVMLIAGCATAPQTRSQPQEVIITVQSTDPAKVEISEAVDSVSKQMLVPNPEGSLSGISFIANGKGFIKIFSGLSVSDVTSLWNDLVFFEENTTIRDVNVYINSPGGDAFCGLALADQIQRAQRKGFKITAFASGIVASAAIPVFAVCEPRIAAPGTIFMVHEAALWKWPGRKTASDIRSQNDLMELLRNRYIGTLVENSKLTKEEWETMEKKTTWFSAEKALEWGLVDEIN